MKSSTDQRFNNSTETLDYLSSFFLNGNNKIVNRQIGAGAIIAANSTVVKDLEPYSIVGGNPATEIKKRFSPDVIEQLLQLKWWDGDLEKITKNVQYLTGADINQLLKISKEK